MPGPTPQAKFCSVFQWPWGKWAAQINNLKSGKKQWLGSFATADEATRAYDAMAVQYHGQWVQLNFPAHAARALERVPLNMRIVSRAKDKEHLKAEVLIYACQGSDPLVVRWMNEGPHLYALNESLLNAAAMKKDEEESDGDDDFWDEVFSPQGVEEEF
jgi:hypothetical protein